MRRFLHIKFLLLLGLNILFGFSAYSQSFPNFTLTQTVCLNNTVTYTAYGFDGSTMYFDVYESNGTTTVSYGNELTKVSSAAPVVSDSETYYKYTLDYQWTTTGSYVVKVRELSSNGCEGEGVDVLTVTVSNYPVITNPGDQSVCDTYTLPEITGTDLTAAAYFTGTGGTGTQYAAGDAIASSQTLYIYDANGTCSDEESFVVTIDPLPTATAGGSSTICPTGSVMVTGASSENGTISWTHDGAGSLSDATTINPTYTASSSDLGNTVTLTLTVTGEDSCNGESATAEYTIYVADDTAPVADVASLSTITAQCEVTSLTAPTATDACVGTITGTHDATLPISGEGSTTVTWTYDDGNGNTSTQTQTVTIDDTTAPVTPTLTDVTVGECSGTPTAPTTTDACAGTITGTTSTVFPITTQGTTIVTWTFADGNGNSTTADQNVIVDDTSDPTITAPAGVTANSDSGSCDAAASGITLGTPTTDDNCGVASVTNDAPSTFPLGATTVTWTVTDNAGLTATATQTVTVSDSENPTITAPADVTANSDSGSCDAAASGITLGTPTTDDNCGVASVTNDAPSTFPLGATTVTWTVTDNAGLTATDTQIVTVDDTTAPILADLSDLDIEDCADDETSQTKIVTGLALDATRYSDNCSSTFTIQYRIQLPDSSYANEYGSSATEANSSSDPSGYEFEEGTSIIYFRVLDENGNISNVQSFTISVDHKPNPSGIFY